MHRLMHHSHAAYYGVEQKAKKHPESCDVASVLLLVEVADSKKQKHSFSTRQKWINSYLGVSRGWFSCFLDLSRSLIHCRQPIEAKHEGDWVKLLCITLKLDQVWAREVDVSCVLRSPHHKTSCYVSWHLTKVSQVAAE